MRSRSGPSPYFPRKRCSSFIAEWSTWNFWAGAIMHGRRLMIPIASVVTEWSLEARFHEMW
jgi:hypothetical protein